MGRLDGKVAIVTSGGQGIGRGIALAMAREGAAISIAELGPETGSANAREFEKIGNRALATVCDVSVREQVDEVVAADPINISDSRASDAARNGPRPFRVRVSAGRTPRSSA